jgi:predicted permease
LLTESVLLGVIGGVLGVGLGALGVELLTTLGADALPRAGAIGLDLRVLAATLVLAIAAGTLSGLIPIVRLRRIDLSTIFRDEGRSGTASRGTLATRAALVVTQLGVAFALLVAAGLLLVSFGRTLAVDPGFRPEGVLTARVALPVTRYADGPARRAFFTRVLADVRRIPGVEAAGLTNVLPFTGDYNSSVMHAEGYEVQPGESLLSPISTVASDGYFEALGLRLVRGRTFEAGDLEDRQPVAIIDRWLAERYWPGRDPVGLRMTQGAPGVVPDSLLEYRTVVGIVEDVRVGNLTGEQTNGHYYFPLAQQPVGGAFLALRTGGDPLALLPALRRTVAAIDPELPVYSVETMPDRISDSVRTERARAFLIAAFAAVALFLAAVGIYGVLAYSVAQRRGEIGIRVALGSSRGDVFRLVVGQGARMVVAGLVVGGVGSVALARALRSMLYGVGPADPRVFAAVLVVLSATALAACLLPARRAMRVDPMTALRD